MYLFCGGFGGGPGLEGDGIFPSENHGKTRVLGPGAAPPAPVCTQSGEERISGKRKNFRLSVFPSFLPSLSPSFDSDPGPLALFCRPQGPNFFAGENILAGPKYFVFGGKARQRDSGVGWGGKIFGTVRRNLSGS